MEQLRNRKKERGSDKDLQGLFAESKVLEKEIEDNLKGMKYEIR
jgi:hypothetical protein